ncbi:hypothetical protein KAR91_51305 [Candidatus Pacearchaeota archaeon]|nr:hypothetical protein [Candidatus Pacearchaeota archaeon]
MASQILAHVTDGKVVSRKTNGEKASVLCRVTIRVITVAYNIDNVVEVHCRAVEL